MCVLSQQLTGIQENVDALPSETVTEVIEITETDIANEQQIGTEIQGYTESPAAPG